MLPVLWLWFLTVSLPSVLSLELDGRVNQEIKELMDKELGVTFMQNYLDTTTMFEAHVEDGKEIADKLANILETKFHARSLAVEKLKMQIERNINNFNEKKYIEQCCHMTKTMTYHDNFKAEVRLTDVCLYVSHDTPYNVKVPPYAVLEQFKMNLNNNRFLTWQFLAMESGITLSYPSRKVAQCDFDARFRPWYIETAAPCPKDVVIVIDRSGSMGRVDMNMGMKLLDIAKDTSKNFLKSLTVRDRVGVISFATYAETARMSTLSKESVPCLRHRLAWASNRNKQMLENYIDKLKSDGGSNYQRGLYKAYQMFNATPTDRDFEHRDKVVVFISDGNPTDAYTGMEEILAFMKDNHAPFNNSIIIMTVATALVDHDGEELLMSMTKTAANKRGEYRVVSDANSIRGAVTTFFRLLCQVQNKPVISLPYIDPFMKSVVVSITLPLFDRNKNLMGVVGTDVSLLETLHEYESPALKAGISYAYVTNANEEILAHPLVPCSGIADNLPVHVSVKNLEHHHEYDSKTCKAFTIYPDQMDLKTYYTLCVILINNETVRLRNINTFIEDVSFVYHNLTEIHAHDTRQTRCKRFNKIATKTSSVVKFGMESYLSPKRYHEREAESLLYIQSLEEDMKDPDHPTILTVDAMHDVYITSVIEQIWLKKANQNNTDDLSNWRYIAMASGMMRIYPGTSLAKDYNPTKRPWYVEASEMKDAFVLVGPYLDVLGSGNIVTASKALYSTSPKSRDVVGVMGVDLSVNFLYSKVQGNYPKCMLNGNSCFLVDSKGYIIVHKQFVDLNGLESPVSHHAHITEKEPSVAKHMIAKKHLTKHRCLDFCNSRHNFFYTVSVTVAVSYWDQPLKYEILPVNGTNVYLIIEAHKFVSPECACDKEDITLEYSECREDFETSECQCPCHSRNSVGVCSNIALLYADDHDTVCKPDICQKPIPVGKKIEIRSLPSLSMCWVTDCSSMKTKNFCYLQSECTWCVLDQQGRKLEEPFCGKLMDCYLGKVGYDSPYYYNDGPLLEPSKIVGHVITLIVFAVIIGLGVIAFALRWVKTCMCPKTNYDDVDYELDDDDDEVVTQDSMSSDSLSSDEDLQLNRNSAAPSEYILRATETHERIFEPAPDDPKDPKTPQCTSPDEHEHVHEHSIIPLLEVPSVNSEPGDRSYSHSPESQTSDDHQNHVSDNKDMLGASEQEDLWVETELSSFNPSPISNKLDLPDSRVGISPKLSPLEITSPGDIDREKTSPSRILVMNALQANLSKIQQTRKDEEGSRTSSPNETIAARNKNSENEEDRNYPSDFDKETAQGTKKGGSSKTSNKYLEEQNSKSKKSTSKVSKHNSNKIYPSEDGNEEGTNSTEKMTGFKPF